MSRAAHALLALPLAALAGRADYPSPAAAGFHHCALIYDRATRTADDLLCFVADVRDGRPAAWLFDAFLFLNMTGVSGESTMTGTMTEADLDGFLDTWFAPDRDLAALEAAIERAAEVLGEPPGLRRVMLMIPRLTDLAAIDRFVGAAQERFAAAGFRRLELWGCYWMHETIPPADEPFARAAAEAVHRRGLRLLWIPWYRATGWDRWRECGIDVAIMQPNYAFFSDHGGGIRRDRLWTCAEESRERGLGVEIELPMAFRDPRALEYWRDYLVDGGRLGYKQAATAYYLGRDNVEACARADAPHERRLYALLADYVRGEAVPEPPRRLGGGDGRWQVDLGGEPIGEIDLFWRGPVDGQAMIQVRNGDTGRAAGWALRGSGAGRYVVATVPVEGGPRRLEVSLEPAAEVFDIIPRPVLGTGRLEHLALGLAYTGDPSPPQSYPDTGGELTDGVVPEGGFASGQTVGWYGGEVAVSFDLGAERRIDAIEVHLSGGGYAAVNWPDRALALLAVDRPPPARMAGRGPMPAGLSGLAAGAPVIDRRRAEDDLDGRLSFAGPATARYVTLLFGLRGWLMLSEVRIVAGGVNLAAGAEYTVRPWPSPAATEAYPDDGVKLTDGVVAHAFSRRDLIGWSDGAPRSWTVDLGAARPLESVAVWAMRGGLYGIFAPARVSLEVSDDGVAWRAAGAAESEALPEPGEVAEAAEYRVAAGAAARWVRVTVTPSRGWAMVSELSIR